MLQFLKDKFKPFVAAFAVGGIVFLGLIISIWILDKFLAYKLAESYVDRIADVFDINRHFAEAITFLVAVAIAVASGFLLTFDGKKRRIGLAALIGLLVINSVVLGIGTREHKVSTQGAALKCYFFLDGKIEYREYRGRPAVDPVTGRQCRPVTPDILERLSDYERGLRAKEVVQSKPSFFDPLSGNPRVWYVRSADGKIRLFDLPGFDPESGAALVPTTHEIAKEWERERSKEKEDAARNREPGPIDPKSARFFNSTSGLPMVWYWRSEDGRFEFFDNSGFHPRTGDKLLPVSKEIIREWQREEEDRRKKVEKEQAERERAKRLEKERIEREQREATERARAERERQEAAERARIERERQEAAERTRIERERWEAAERARIERERHEAAERVRIAAEQAECERWKAEVQPGKLGNIIAGSGDNPALKIIGGITNMMEKHIETKNPGLLAGRPAPPNCY